MKRISQPAQPECMRQHHRKSPVREGGSTQRLTGLEAARPLVAIVVGCRFLGSLSFTFPLGGLGDAAAAARGCGPWAGARVLPACVPQPGRTAAAFGGAESLDRRCKLHVTTLLFQCGCSQCRSCCPFLFPTAGAIVVIVSGSSMHRGCDLERGVCAADAAAGRDPCRWRQRG